MDQGEDGRADERVGERKHLAMEERVDERKGLAKEEREDEKKGLVKTLVELAMAEMGLEMLALVGPGMGRAMMMHAWVQVLLELDLEAAIERWLGGKRIEAAAADPER